VDLDHLWDVAEREAARSGFRFEGGSAGYVREMLEARSEALDVETLPEDSEEAIDFELGTRLWVYAMVLQAQKQGFEELHEATFFGARDWLCPGFRPFC
jgi:hypothetical protein